MTDVKTTDVNSRSAVLSAIILGTIGVLSFIVQPGLVQGFVTEFGLSEAQANGLAFSEMAGVALATIVLVIINRFINWRVLLATGLVLAAIGNIGSAFLASVSSFNGIRFVTGLGEGVVISLSFTFIGLTSRTDRNVALYLVLLLTYGALGLWAMPFILGTFGLKAIFFAWGIMSLLALLSVNYVPSSSNEMAEKSPDEAQISWGLITAALLGCLVYNTAIGLAWANLFLIGMEVRPDEQSIANALLIAQFIAIPGALLAFFLAPRIPRWALIISGILLGTAAIAMLLGRPDYTKFILAISAFNFLWNLVLPFILSAISDMDEKGRAMPFAIACQMIGLGFGPGIAAKMLGDGGGFESIKMLTIQLMVLSLILYLVPIYMHRRALKAKTQ